jgi:rubrerythrin
MSLHITSAKELLKRAIKGEYDGLRFYTYLTEKTVNADARNKLSGLASDEKRHVAILENMFKQLYKEEVGELPKEGINALAKFFDGSKAKDKHTEMQFIDLAIEAELAATQFYRNGAETASEQEVKKLYQELADEEFRHYESLQAEKSALGGNYFWFGYGESSPMEE